MDFSDISGIIFDMDGTVLSSMHIWQDLGVRLLKSHNIEAKPGLSELLFLMSIEQGAEYLKNEYKLDMTVSEIIDELHDVLKEFYYEEVELKDGILEVLKLFSSMGIPMISATSSPREHIYAALKRNHIEHFFIDILTTSDYKTSKHEPTIYYECIKKMGTIPSNTLVFEDALYAIKTAKAAGFITVGVFDDYGETDNEGVKIVSDYYIEKYEDFLKAVSCELT